MKRKIVIPLAIVVALIGIGASQFPKLYIATGYGAKAMATAVFVAGRDPQLVKITDLNYSVVKYTQSVVNYQSKTVTTSFWGIAGQTAVYREGYGCCLVGDLDSKTIQKNSFQPQINRKVGAWQISWPDGDRVKDTIYNEINKSKLETAIDAAFDGTKEYNKGTAAVVVLYKGELIAEKYAKELGINSETRLWGWSMTKSIMNAMAGVLAKKGKLDVNAVAPIPQWLNDRRRDITINNLLQMSSGLKWNEDYGDVSSATKMLYRTSDCYQMAIEVPFQSKPGAEWNYSSGTANILSGMFRSLIGDDVVYHNFPYMEIFNKIGMSSAIIETDAAGNFVGSSFGYATARDWARFGLLFYNDGVWKNDTILPKGWVSYSRTPATASNGVYGAQFWLNKSKKLPDVPEDLFSCNGHRGQRIYIIPSRNLVIVRLGFSEEHFDHNEFLKEILASIR